MEAVTALVQAISDMDDRTFALHMTHRHREDLAGQTELIPYAATMPAYRRFHDRLHTLKPHAYQHEHEK